MALPTFFADKTERRAFVLELINNEVKARGVIQADLCLASPGLAFGEEPGKHHDADL
jgi:hypothetical protein